MAGPVRRLRQHAGSQAGPLFPEEPEPPPTPSSDSSYDHDDSLDDSESSDDWQPDTPDAVAPSRSPRYACCTNAVVLCLSSPGSPFLALPLLFTTAWISATAQFGCAQRTMFFCSQRVPA